MKNESIIRKLREKKGESISSMAKRLKIGISRYYMIENGERPATPEIAKNIAKMLEVEQDEIFLPQSFTVREIGNFKPQSA